MKMAKSYKILLLIAAFVLSVILGVGAFAFKPVNAEMVEGPKLTDYFSGTGVTSDEMTFDASGNAKFKVNSGDEVKIKNKLVIEKFKTELVFDTAEIEKFQIILKYDSYYVNGNKNVDDNGTADTSDDIVTFDQNIENVCEVQPGEVTITVDANCNVLVNGESKGNYYRIRKVDRAVASITFRPVLKQNVETSAFEIKYVTQDADNDNYKQEFKLESGKLKAATPIVTVNTPIFVKTDVGYKLRAYAGDFSSYALTYNVYSVVGNVATSELYPTIPETETNISIPEDKDDNNHDRLFFKEGGVNSTFNICGKEDGTEKVYATYEVEVLDKLTKKDTGNDAPKYVLDEDALDAFEYQLKNQYYKENIDEDNNESHYVALGTTIEIPSLEDLIVDDRTPYSKLTKTVKYVCSEPLATNSSMEIELNYLGDYFFFVVANDDEGGKMADIVEFDENGIPKNELPDVANDFVFKITIEDDAIISIEKPSKQGAGYVGTRYTASKFDINAVNCVEEFTLYYNSSIGAKEGANGWVEIKKVSEVSESYSENGITYKDISAIDYDGSYVFTPNKAGTYMIKCQVTSEISFREASETMLINVSGDPKVVTPVKELSKDNTWSIVFLSIGSACLVAIVVLLCIKPKDKKSEE